MTSFTQDDRFLRLAEIVASAGRPETAAYAEAAFGDTAERVRRVHGPVDGPDSSWRSSVFEVQPGREPDWPTGARSWP